MSYREYRFEVTPDGTLVDSGTNVEPLRKLWLDRSVIKDAFLGERRRLRHGAWHIACNLVAAARVRQSEDGRLLWLEISHDSRLDTYFATGTTNGDTGPSTWPISSPEGGTLLRRSVLVGLWKEILAAEYRLRALMTPLHV